tara:strand:- start:654 stop:893 length:240 start_codon:yes stop_codon:yes gene_type:complete
MREILFNLKAQSWCIEKGYKIYPIPQNNKGTKCKIGIELGNKKAITKEIYTNKEVSTEIWKLFTKLYKRWEEQNKTQHT